MRLKWKNKIYFSIKVTFPYWLEGWFFWLEKILLLCSSGPADCLTQRGAEVLFRLVWDFDSVFSYCWNTLQSSSYPPFIWDPGMSVCGINFMLRPWDWTVIIRHFLELPIVSFSSWLTSQNETTLRSIGELTEGSPCVYLSWRDAFRLVCDFVCVYWLMTEVSGNFSHLRLLWVFSVSLLQVINLREMIESDKL